MKSIAFAAIAYGIAIGISLLVAGIIKIIYFLVHRGQSKNTATDRGGKA